MTPAASVGDGDRLRLFLALQLPTGTLDVLESWQARHLPSGRRVPREHLHVTLAFLGSRPGAELAGDRRRCCAPPPRMPASSRSRPSGGARRGASGCSCFAISRAGPTALAEALHARLEALGVYRREARPWLPHLTVLRFRERPRLRPPLPETGTFVPSGAAAYLSRLHPTGARYEVLARVSLTAGG